MLSSQERNRLIKKIKQASGIAQYALLAKMTDEKIVEAAAHLEILELIRDANNYNRYCQGKKTQQANDRFNELVKNTIDNSEFLKAGKWLFNAISMTEKERNKTLIEKGLVHKEEYNRMVAETKDTVLTVFNAAKDSTEKAVNDIQKMQERIDSLRHQLSQVQSYISNNYGTKEWKNIKETFYIEKNDDEDRRNEL